MGRQRRGEEERHGKAWKERQSNDVYDFSTFGPLFFSIPIFFEIYYFSHLLCAKQLLQIGVGRDSSVTTSGSEGLTWASPASTCCRMRGVHALWEMRARLCRRQTCCIVVVSGLGRFDRGLRFIELYHRINATLSSNAEHAVFAMSCVVVGIDHLLWIWAAAVNVVDRHRLLYLHQILICAGAKRLLKTVLLASD